MAGVSALPQLPAKEKQNRVINIKKNRYFIVFGLM